ncbi:MAG: hypothetical protein ACTSVV_10705 [Promethearchaeota archaeon]
MQVKEIYKGLYLYTFPNQFELCSHFFRLQEFYESPIKQVRGKYFTLEDAITYYAYDQKEEPKFTYFEDWAGFNVPGNIVNNFYRIFRTTLTNKERALFDEIIFEKEHEDFYLIGVIEGEEETMKHEVAHGFYYLNKAYKKEMNKLIKELPQRMKDRIKKELLSLGYCKQVVKDETQAYLATGIREGMVSIIDYTLYWNLIKKFEKVFKKYYAKIK